MVDVFLIALAVFYAPIPWLVVLAHVFSLQNKNKKRLVYLLALILWLILGWLAFSYYSQILSLKFNSSNVFIGLGIVMLITALLIEIASRMVLSSKRIMGSSEFSKNKDRLVTTGIYKYARHPRHVEHPLWFLGLGLMFSSSFLIWFSAYLFISLVVATYFEEKELIQRYGQEYTDYKRKTPAFFIF